MDKRKVQSVIFYCDADKNKYFLLLKTNERRKLFWQNVTGSVDNGENFIQAAIREAQEESKLTVENIDSVIETSLEFTFPDRWSDENCLEKVFFLKCKQKWDVIIDESEHSEFKWLNANEISENSVKFESNFIALKEAIKLIC
jgi:8-oxo-dGTP pyrophosphatase MutT (NUDIX family)